MAIRLLTFDLDDTLWELAPVLVRAETIAYTWLQLHAPAVTSVFSIEDLRNLRLQIAREQPDLAHRISELRRSSLRQAMRIAEIGEELLEPLTERAFAVLLAARHDVELFDGVEDALAKLKRDYKLGVITNGNFDISRIAIGHYFDFAVVAEKLTRAKPHPEPFEHALMLAQCSAQECIHIGDDCENDVRGAQRVGMHTIWVNRYGERWQGNAPPSAEIRHLADLPDAVSEISERMGKER